MRAARRKAGAREYRTARSLCSAPAAAYIKPPIVPLGEPALLRFALALALCLGFAAAEAQTVEKAVPQSPTEVHLSFAPVVKKVRPAVVNVYASRVETMARNPLFDDPIFRQFFGQQGQESRVAQSLGSGVIVDASGLVVTNHHVIEGMTDVKVALSDRREFAGQDRAARSAHRSGGAANSERRALSRARTRGFRRDRGRRLRAGDRQSLRRRPDRDAGHRLRARAHADRHQRLRLLHPDRRRDQPRQFRRRAGRSRRAAHRHQFGDRFALGRQRGARLRHPRQYGQERRRGGQDRRRHGQAAVARRQPAERLQGHRQFDRPGAARRRAGRSASSKAARPRRRG